MILLYLAALLAEADHYDNFVYLRGECLALELGHRAVHMGIAKGECEDIARADRELNRVYRRKIAALNQNDRMFLRRSERVWIKSAIRACGLNDDGLVENESDSDCFMKELKERTRFIQAFKRAPAG